MAALAEPLSLVVLAWAAGLLAGPALQRLLRPATGAPRRPWACHAIAAGLWTLAFAAGLLLTGRPWFAAGLGLALQLLVILVNNAKYRALREPFLFSDFGLFSQALRHPRLYLPFLGVGPGLAGAAAIGATVYLGLRLEAPLPEQLGWPAFAALTLALGGLGALGLGLGTRHAPVPTLLPHDDLARLGLPASLWLYWRAERRDPAPTPRSPFAAVCRAPAADDAGGELPDIVAVQSESFCDARRMFDGVRPELLRHFDQVCREALLHGRLTVPAWGANTMRTEFGFLTGIAADALGVHRFNPYRCYARRPLASLATCLKAQGYRTVCIHPHPASFFARDRVYPGLGFDEFVDVRRFDASRTFGPYVSDAAVSDMVEQVLDRAAGPLFVFVITMENHGPLHLERVDAGELPRFYDTLPPAGFEDLSVYLRHLGNADAMIGRLTRMLRGHVRPGLLCLFGDHVPSLPEVYARTGYADARTDYFVWRPDRAPGERRDLAVEQLGLQVLQAAAADRAQPGSA